MFPGPLCSLQLPFFGPRLQETFPKVAAGFQPVVGGELSLFYFLANDVGGRGVESRGWAVYFLCMLAVQLLAEHADSLHVTSGFEATINKFDSNFSAHLLDLLDKLSIYSTNDCEHSMINIIYR